jgi:NADPH-dependent 2,4-dienoyl-CoA reductase/sulfur reductase-like enzyme
MHKVVIVGAGPAGISAAELLVANGIRPTLIDEAATAGGQIYRRPAPHINLDMGRLLGRDNVNYESFHARADNLLPRVNYRPRTTAWALFGDCVWTVSDDVIEQWPYDALILATGATDRTIPVPGWTLPGVFTLGGAQVLLKGQGALIGRRVVFGGSSPLLYLAAKQYLAAGATVAAILDTTPFGAKVAAAWTLLSAPTTFARGLTTMAQVRSSGVPIHHGVRLEAFEGEGGISAVRYLDRAGHQKRVECDAVAFSFGLKPESQLADLAGISFRYDETFRQWLPAADGDGRAGARTYVAGDGFTIGGAQAAKVSGMLAAAALLEDVGTRVQDIDRSALRRQLARLRSFQRGLARGFAWPTERFASMDDNLAVCRCENVTVGDIRCTILAALGPTDINRVKALTRVGMGRCQGRFCGLAAAEIVAAAAGRPLETAGRLRSQAPVKPLPPTARELTPP